MIIIIQGDNISIIIARDDLIPLMESYGMASILEDLAAQNASMEKAIAVIEWELSQSGIYLSDISESRIEHLVADLIEAGKLMGSEIALGSNVEATARAAAPSGIGVGNGNVWVTPPGESYALRFYVNGQLKTTLTNYYITDLASIGAVSGDTVQVAQVVGGVVGWWASKAVP